MHDGSAEDERGNDAAIRRAEHHVSNQPKILFVDDEGNILQGLRRMLHPMAREWAMEFVQSGQQALDILARDPVDVIVTDMRMPGMDGAELLVRVRESWPQVTRIVLSGHSDQEGVIRSINAAHQYLIKPCEPGLLKSVVTRALRLRGFITSPGLRSLVAKLNHVPSLPSLYSEITAALADKDRSVRDIGDIVARDVGFSIKLLQLVNSAFFGLPRPVSSPGDAAILLGTDLIRALVLGTMVFSTFEEHSPGATGTASLWQHCLRTGSLARKLAGRMRLDRRDVDAAFLSGFVHDIGRLVLQQNLPDDCARCAALAGQQGIPYRDAEVRTFGVAHEVVAASMLGMWGLPDTTVEAVAYLHRPSESPAQTIGPLTAVHLAEFFDQEMQGASHSTSVLDEAYVANLGLLEQVAAWRGDLESLCATTTGAT